MTQLRYVFCNFVALKNVAKIVRGIHIIAFTHRQLEVSQIGFLHIEEDRQKSRLNALKSALELEELLFLSTCNRVAFIFKTDQEIDESFMERFITTLYPDFDQHRVHLFTSSYEYYQEINGVKHFIKVASSVDSMIVGEREIITQVRKAFDLCKSYGITGDSIRLLIRYTIETAKKIYTETNIAERPVSVVSLAYHTLRTKDIPLDARILVVGAGVTNTNMLRFLRKHGFSDFAIFNRTFEKAELLANEVKGKAYPLEDLQTYNRGFDVIITCTGAEEAIITPELYKSLLVDDQSAKTVIDLAIPHDLAPEIKTKHLVEHISIDELQVISRKNLKERTKEIIHVDHIIAEAVLGFRALSKEREVELAMNAVPTKVKEIKATALNHVFAKEIAALDDNSKETVEKIMSYLEKKYMSIPMKMAKEILLNK